MRLITSAVMVLALASSVARAADQTRKDETPKPDTAKPENKLDAEKQALYQQLEKTLSGVKLVGRFTVIGKEEGPLAKEEYTIKNAKKLPNGDYWQLDTRIKYGNIDLDVPLPLEIKWAGDTPVITLTKFTIPGLGTFGARVVIHDNKYAGTWSHDAVGGHLFGTIEKIEKEKPKEEK